jgi:hypothetical protein
MDSRKPDDDWDYLGANGTDGTDNDISPGNPHACGKS